MRCLAGTSSFRPTAIQICLAPYEDDTFVFSARLASGRAWVE